MPLSPADHSEMNKILARIIPNDVGGRDALLYSTLYSDETLRQTIDTGGAMLTFLNRLVMTLTQYGTIGTEPALVVFLQNAKQYIGDDGKLTIDRLSEILRDDLRQRQSQPANTPLPATPTQPIPSQKVFISYSHKDESYMERLRIFLKPYVREGNLLDWADSRIKPAQDWRKEIKTAISEAGAFVILLSQDYIASDFVAQNETPQMLQAAKTRKIPIYWVKVKPCNAKHIPGLGDIQAVHDPAKSLVQMLDWEQDQVWDTMAEAIAADIDEKTQKPTA